MPTCSGYQSTPIGTLLALSKENAERFNKATPNAQGVYYQSFAGISRGSGNPQPADIEACGSMWPKTFAFQVAASPQLAVSAAMTGAVPSDGIVPVSSAKWGEFRGCIAADHMDQVGFYPGNREGTRFDHITFYRLVAADLADMGY